jgi:hypothetical protein
MQTGKRYPCPSADCP